MFLINNIHPSWSSFISSHIKKIKEIETQIGNDFYPNAESVFRFMKNDLANVKCVIVGMDPYPQSYVLDGAVYPEATGRSFEVGSMKEWTQKIKQASLRNILKTLYYNATGQIVTMEEIREKIKEGEFVIPEPHKWFDITEQQGVLWLNSTLTVKPGVPGSHTKIWEEFFEKLCEYIQENNPNITWVLWGNNAAYFERTIKKGKVIKGVHPRISSFVKENVFEKIKEVEW